MATASPFHRGEQEIQTRLGMRDQIEAVGQRFIRSYLPDEHRDFYAGLPFLVVGSVDRAGRPWASLLTGRPGFIATPDATTLSISARPSFGDPLNETLAEGARLGFLGIEYDTRRRNRLTGRVTAASDRGIDIRIDQSFGNCPKFIQARAPEFMNGLENVGEPRPMHQLDRLDDRAREIIAAADHFFIATHYSEDDGDRAQGTDVSHRGGKPGFVRIEDDATLTFPDFSGNYHFNTLGNILLNSRAGLLFIDFASGDLLYLACTAKIIWDGEDLATFSGAERLVQFTVEEARRVENALPLKFSFIDYSPFLKQTGSWEAVAEKSAAREQGNRYREYSVTRIEPESDTIRSFYLEPREGEDIPCHRAGQFLPIEVVPPDANEPVQRTYTISNAPNGSYYRLSIKRETPSAPGVSPGIASNLFHDHFGPGTTIRALSPRGQFTLDTSSTRPVVLISAGVGITPMISMLEQLDRDRATCGCTRKVWFIHGARNAAEQAFGDFVRGVAANWPTLTTHFRFSRPADDDAKGRDYDSTGRVDVQLLKSLLPFDDYEFYLCGPAAFIEAIYQDLKDLNMADDRIHYEYFGPGNTLSSSRPGSSAATRLKGKPPVPVQFAKSGIEVTWDAGKGTLLDLAESEGLEPAYSCRSGVCQTCAVSVLSGSAEYLDQPALPPPEGMALICSAYPVTDPDDHEPGPIILDI